MTQVPHPEAVGWAAIPTLPNAVADWLASQIVRGRFITGERIREAAIAEELHVSRAPVREALRILHEQGFVEHKPRIGAVVCEFSLERVTGIYEIRSLLEGWAARSAAPHLSPEDLAQMRKILADMRSLLDSADYVAFYERGWEFRGLLYGRCPNVAAYEVIRLLRSWLHTLPTMTQHDPLHAKTYLDTYSSVLEAAQNGDVAGVGRLIAAHMESFGTEVSDFFTRLARDQEIPPHNTTGTVA